MAGTSADHVGTRRARQSSPVRGIDWGATPDPQGHPTAVAEAARWWPWARRRAPPPGQRPGLLAGRAPVSLLASRAGGEPTDPAPRHPSRHASVGLHPSDCLELPADTAEPVAHSDPGPSALHLSLCGPLRGELGGRREDSRQRVTVLRGGRPRPCLLALPAGSGSATEPARPPVPVRGRCASFRRGADGDRTAAERPRRAAPTGRRLPRWSASVAGPVAAGRGRGATAGLELRARRTGPDRCVGADAAPQRARARGAGPRPGAGLPAWLRCGDGAVSPDRLHPSRLPGRWV